MKILILFFAIIFPLAIISQPTEPIQTDRPDQTETPSIVSKGMFQVENSFSFYPILKFLSFLKPSF